MNRLRLIESFTWMMLNIEWYLLEELDELETSNILKFRHFGEVEKYLKLISKKENEHKFSELDYLESLDTLINMEKPQQLDINEIVLKSYTESDLVRLLKDTVDLLLHIDIIK